MIPKRIVTNLNLLTLFLWLVLAVVPTLVFATGTPTLSDALDTASVVTTGGDASWTTESVTTYYGGLAAQAGLITDGQNSFMESSVPGPKSGSFWWKVSSEEGYDYLRFSIDGVVQYETSGEVAWTQVNFTLPPGTHTLRWTYEKDGSGFAGQDTGWVDQLVMSDLAPSAELAAALDTTFPVYTGGHLPWLSQDTTTVDNILAGKSGALAGGQNSWLAATVTATGLSDTVAFQWKVSSANQFDFLRFSIDGVETKAITGEMEWGQENFPLSAGTHTLLWNYMKVADSAGAGLDTGWVDQLVVASHLTYTISTTAGANGSITPTAAFDAGTNATITVTPATGYHIDSVLVDNVSQTVANPKSHNATFTNVATYHTVSATFAVDLSSKIDQTITFANPGMQVFGTTPGLTATVSSTLLPTFTSATTGVCTVTSDGVLTFVTTGNCTIDADQQGDATYNAAPRVQQTFMVAPPLADALDTAFVVTTGGNNSWFGQSTTTHDQVDAAQAGTIGDGQSSWMETTTTGPQSGSFWWKVSSEDGYDFLRFSIDGVVQYEISSEVAWTQVSFTLPPGTHTLRWTYEKDGSGSAGQDTGWVDQIVMTDLAPTASLATALDTTFPVYTGGHVPWASQSTTTNDGILAAQSGVITGGQNSWLAATVITTGSDTVSFQWKVSSANEFDYLRFYLDGTETRAITGEMAWGQESFPLTAGTHTLLWSYQKRADSAGAGTDTGWVDQLVVASHPTYTISTTAGANGSITPTTVVDAGATVTISVTPVTGYHINSVLVDNVGQNIADPKSYSTTFTNVAAAHTVSATFAMDVSKTDQTITFVNPGSKIFGTTSTLTATATSGLAPTFTSATTGVCTITSGGALNFITTGSCTINADQVGNGAYNSAPRVSQTFAVTKATATVALSNLTQSYTGSALTPTATTTPSGLAVTWTNAPQTNVGSYSVTATINDTNYQGFQSGAFTISKVNQATLTVTGPASVTYGSTGNISTSGGSGTGTMSYSAGSSTGCSVNASTGVISVTNASGTCSITATRGTDSNYNATTSNTVSVTLNKAGQTITFANPGAKTYGTTPTLTATATSGLAPTFTSATNEVCTITSGGVLTFVTSGNCSIDSDQAGNGNYNSALQVSQTFAVNKATATAGVTSGTNPITYGNSVTLSATVTPVAATGTVSFKDGATTLATVNVSGGAASYTAAGLNAGSHGITVVYSGDANYNTATSSVLTQTVNKAATSSVVISSKSTSTVGDSVTLTATVTPSTASGTVTFKDGATTIGTGTISSGTASITLTNLATGVRSITAVYGGDSNYNTSTSSAITQTVQVVITVTTSVAGLAFTVDNTSYTTPQTFIWTPGTSHSIGTTQYQGELNGSRYAFNSWSDGGGQSHGFSVPGVSTTYTANFVKQYQLTTSSAGGAMIPFGSTYYAENSVVSISVSLNFGYKMLSWTVNGTTTLSSVTSTQVTMTAPTTVTAEVSYGTPLLSATYVSKSKTTSVSGGITTYNSLWNFKLTNNGTAVAANATIDSLTLTKTTTLSPSCSAVVGVLPSGKSIAVAGTGTYPIPITFTNCASNVTFKAALIFSNNGTNGGTFTINGMTP